MRVASTWVWLMAVAGAFCLGAVTPCRDVPSSRSDGPRSVRFPPVSLVPYPPHGDWTPVSSDPVFVRAPMVIAPASHPKQLEWKDTPCVVMSVADEIRWTRDIQIVRCPEGIALLP